MAHNPEEDFQVTFTDDGLTVQHPLRDTQSILWNAISEIKLINTDDGPFAPDVWLALIGEGSACLVPQGAPGYDEVYDRVSKYPGFNFDNVIESMSCVDNAEFLLWKKN